MISRIFAVMLSTFDFRFMFFTTNWSRKALSGNDCFYILFLSAIPQCVTMYHYPGLLVP